MLQWRSFFGKIYNIIRKGIGGFLLDKLIKSFYDKDYSEKAVRKRSTSGYPAERTVHRLKGSLGEDVWKVALEPEV